MQKYRFLILLALPALIFGQNRYVLHDSLARKLSNDSQYIYRKTIAKPYLKLENRNSFIIREPVDFYGGMLGATFWERHTFAAGMYFLDKKSRKPVAISDNSSASQQFLRLSYFNMAYQHVLINRRFIQVNLPVEIGVGSYYAKTTDTGVVIVTKHHGGRFVPFSMGVQTIGKITRWLGISGSGGYRYVRNEDVLLKFNGFYFSFGLWIDARQLFRDYKYRRAKKHYFRLQERISVE